MVISMRKFLIRLLFPKEDRNRIWVALCVRWAGTEKEEKALVRLRKDFNDLPTISYFSLIKNVIHVTKK